MPQTTTHPPNTPIRIGLYMPRSYMRLHTKRSQWDFSIAVLDDVLRVYPKAKVEVTSGAPGETIRRLEVTGTDPDAVRDLVRMSIAAHQNILTEDRSKTGAVVLSI